MSVFESPDVVLEAGSALRLAVVDTDTGARSSTWRVWTSKNQDDLYISGRAIAGTSKASLHASGSWSFGFVSHENKPPWVPDATRHLDIWPRPYEVAPGLTRAFAIVVPHSVLRTAPPDTGDIFEIPAPGVGHAVWVEVFLGKAGSLTAAAYDEGHDLAVMSLANGDQVRLLAMRRPLSDDDQRWLDNLRSSALAQRPASMGPMPQVGGVAAFFTELDGLRVFVEIGHLQP